MIHPTNNKTLPQKTLWHLKVLIGAMLLAILTTNEGKNYDLDHSLDQLQKMIDPNLFFRINRNYLANINCIDEILFPFTFILK